MDKITEGQKSSLKQHAEKFNLTGIEDDVHQFLAEDIKDVNMLMFVSLVKYIISISRTKDRSLDSVLEYIRTSDNLEENEEIMRMIYGQALDISSEKKVSRKDDKISFFSFKFDLVMLFKKLKDFQDS